MNDHSRTTPILLLAWFMFWPVSELFGRPPEAGEPIRFYRGLKLIGVATTIGLALSVVFLVLEKLNWLQ